MKTSMKLPIFTLLFVLAISCKSLDINSKQGTFVVPAKGELRQWQNIEHNSFSLHLENKSVKNSCEAYKVTANGNEKWISPSLLKGGTLDFTILSDGSLLLKNFSDENITVEYTIN